MKIGITCYASQGGSGIVATELGKWLAREGHEVHFITQSVPVRLREFTQNIYFHEVQVQDYPLFSHAPYSLSLSAKMAEVTEFHGLDILHVHYAIPHAVSSYVAKQMVRPRVLKTVTTLHGTDITLVGVLPSFYKVTKFSIEQSDAVTAVSEFLRKETVEHFEIDRPISVIENFVDPDVFRPRDSNPGRRLFAPRGEHLLMHASNFRPVKNVETVVRVFATIREKVRARLLMVGEGPERVPAERLARKLKVTEDVIFLGGQEFIEDLLPMVDLFLLPSEHESFGLVALEAMASGAVVIATTQGGVREVIEEGRTGFLRDPGDVRGMAELAVELLEDPARRGRIRAAAREAAETRWSIHRIAPRYVEVYESLLAGLVSG